MKKLLNTILKFSWQKILAAAVFILVCCLCSLLFGLTTSCSSARLSVSGDRHKVVKDSTHYDVHLQK